MSRTIEDAVTRFCAELPNLEKVHHPNDLSRLGEIIKTSILLGVSFPYDMIKEKLESKVFMTPNSGNIEDFMESVRIYVEPLLPGLKWANSNNLLVL